MKSTLPTILVRLRWAEPWKGPAVPHLLRGALASAFPDNDLFHQHDTNGYDIYRYPRIHYRWDMQTGDGLVFGVGEGIEVLGGVFNQISQLQLGKSNFSVKEAQIQFSRHSIDMLHYLKRYRFISPWLSLNQKNFSRFKVMSHEQQKKELDRLAVANILSALKGLDIRLDQQIFAAFCPHRTVTTPYKGQRLLGFYGTLCTNVYLPNDFAIGKAVSHGYGWLVEGDTCPS